MTMLERIRLHTPWLEPWYCWGQMNALRLDAHETDFSDESEGPVWALEIQWFGLHLCIQIGRTPPRVPHEEVAARKAAMEERAARG